MKAFAAFILTILAGFIGIYIGSAINVAGYVGIIFAIATMGSCIVSSIEKTK